MKRLFARYFQKVRILIFKQFWTANNIKGIPPTIFQAVILNGEGEFFFDNNVILGYNPSPGFFDTVGYMEARSSSAKIHIGKNVIINNGFSIICDKTLVYIGDESLIGVKVEIVDSDFHGINPKERRSNNHLCSSVIIERNVFIGNRVTILKGVRIGENSIVANSSVVTKSFPANVILGGNPARVLKEIKDDQ